MYQWGQTDSIALKASSDMELATLASPNEDLSAAKTSIN